MCFAWKAVAALTVFTALAVCQSCQSDQSIFYRFADALSGLQTWKSKSDLLSFKNGRKNIKTSAEHLCQ
jgi:hypothetical protein